MVFFLCCFCLFLSCCTVLQILFHIPYLPINLSGYIPTCALRCWHLSKIFSNNIFQIKLVFKDIFPTLLIVDDIRRHLSVFFSGQVFLGFQVCFIISQHLFIRNQAERKYQYVLRCNLDRPCKWISPSACLCLYITCFQATTFPSTSSLVFGYDPRSSVQRTVWLLHVENGPQASKIFF